MTSIEEVEVQMQMMRDMVSGDIQEIRQRIYALDEFKKLSYRALLALVLFVVILALFLAVVGSVATALLFLFVFMITTAITYPLLAVFFLKRVS